MTHAKAADPVAGSSMMLPLLLKKTRTRRLTSESVRASIATAAKPSRRSPTPVPLTIPSRVSAIQARRGAVPTCSLSSVSTESRRSTGQGNPHDAPRTDVIRCSRLSAGKPVAALKVEACRSSRSVTKTGFARIAIRAGSYGDVREVGKDSSVGPDSVCCVALPAEPFKPPCSRLRGSPH